MPVYGWSEKDYQIIHEACWRKTSRRLAQMGLNDENERREYLHQAFVSILIKGELFNSHPMTPETIDYISNYVSKATLNKFLDDKRREKRRKEIHPDTRQPAQESDYTPDEMFDAVALNHGAESTQELYQSSDPAGIYDKQCEFDELRAAIATMKPKEKAVFELLIEGYTRKGAAVKLTISIYSVNKRIERGIAYLKTIL